MKNFLTLLFFSLFSLGSAQAELVLTAVFDCDLSGGTPKGVEIYATADISDLSIYALGSANNGSAGADTIEFNFPAGSLTAGDYIYVASDSSQFDAFFAFFPNYVSSAVNINGDDAVILFKNGAKHDVFGDIMMDGTGQPWEYKDGWAARVPGTGPDATFVLANWTYLNGGVDGETTNATAANPVPIGVYGGGSSADVTVDVGGGTNIFAPADITINVGETVEWVNIGGFHNVDGSLATYPMNPEGFSNGAASTASWTFSHTFGTAGAYDYECTPHAGQGMTGTVTVNALPVVDYPPLDIAVVTTVDTDGNPDSIGVKCSLTGVVHGGDFNEGGTIAFTFIDATGGIGCFSTNDFGWTVTEGDNITIEGNISQFNGLSQISPDTIILNSSGNALVTPPVVTALDESTESELVRINNLYLADPSQWPGTSTSGWNVDVTNGTDTFTMRIDDSVDLFTAAAPTGNFDLIGIGSQRDTSEPRDEGYQIFPRYTADIIPIIPPTISAVDDVVVTEINMPVTINILGNDGLPNALDTVYLVTIPSNGTAGVNMDNTITYAPDVDVCGTDLFTYAICDNVGCDTAMVDITINCPVSYPPYSIATVTTTTGGEPDSLGVTCEITGIVYGVNMTASSGGLQFTIIDANDADAGIGLFYGDGNFGYTVQEGDEVTIQGSVGFFRGMTQMNPDTVWRVSENNALHIPEVVTALGEGTDSKLITIENLTIVDGADWGTGASGFNVEVSNGTDNFFMRVDNDVMDVYNSMIPAQSFNLTGIGGQFAFDPPFDVGYQILPRYLADIDLISGLEDAAEFGKIQVYPNPVSDRLEIVLEEEVDRIQLRNLLGQVILTDLQPELSSSMDLSELPTGIYLLSFYNETGSWTTEVVKQ